MAFSYERIDKNGRLKSYYGTGQEWAFTEKGKTRTIKVEYFSATEEGVQYYFVSIDGRFSDKRMSAARLRYFLHSKKAEEVQTGTLCPMPLLYEEVRVYFSDRGNEREDCYYCGGTGIDDNGKVCRCAHKRTYEIKNYNAELRLKKLLKV